MTVSFFIKFLATLIVYYFYQLSKKLCIKVSTLLPFYFASPLNIVLLFIALIQHSFILLYTCIYTDEEQLSVYFH